MLVFFKNNIQPLTPCFFFFFTTLNIIRQKGKSYLGGTQVVKAQK